MMDQHNKFPVLNAEEMRIFDAICADVSVIWECGFSNVVWVYRHVLLLAKLPGGAPHLKYIASATNRIAGAAQEGRADVWKRLDCVNKQLKRLAAQLQYPQGAEKEFQALLETKRNFKETEKRLPKVSKPPTRFQKIWAKCRKVLGLLKRKKFFSQNP